MMETKQKAEYTFKYNKDLGRHGWLRLTPAYSVKMVERILENLDYVPKAVLEPFSGTGTTELVCANRGIPSYAYDINPFLVWLANTKTAFYSGEILDAYDTACTQIVNEFNSYTMSELPPMHNIGRWWNKPQLTFLAKLKTAIWNVQEESVKNLLKIVFCRLIIELSNAAFNHVSTSFKDSKADDGFSDKIGKQFFLAYSKIIRECANVQPLVSPQIALHNSTRANHDINGKYDTLITSPPYPNRISYIRELRPYMYWLDYLKTSDDASDLDWETIGGTWGAATSKLAQWEQKSSHLPQYLFDIADNIANTDNKSSTLMAKYVLKYFDDMALHFETVYNEILTNGTVHYIVGNSFFYGNEVPSEKLYMDMLLKSGFSHVKSEIVRKRNCNKGLFEYWISAKKCDE